MGLISISVDSDAVSAKIRNIKDYYYTTDNNDYTAAFNRILDGITSDGVTIIIPPGTYTITQVILPRNPVSIIGFGVASRIESNSAMPMFIWAMDTTTPVGASFQNLWLENAALTGGILYHGPSTEFKRLQLTMTDVTCQYRGGCNALYLDGLIASNLMNVDIKGGSPVGGGTFSGTALYIKDSSTSHFWNVQMHSGIAGNGIFVDGGGELHFHGSRLGGGSRNDCPGYWFKNTKCINIEDFCGEGTNDDPWLLIDGCHDIWIKNPIGPGSLAAYNNNNIIEITDSHNVIIQGGRVDDQNSNGGIGKALVIDATSTLVTVQDLRFIGVFLDNFTDAGTGTVLTGFEGGASFYDPPTTRVTYP